MFSTVYALALALAVAQHAFAAVLTLEDGTRWDGVSFGSPLPSSSLPPGEVVYSTSMTGYVEMLTDPSYTGQILVMTFPLVGNHGVPRNGSHPSGLDPRDPRGWSQFEGMSIAVAGLVVSSAVESHPTHHWEEIDH